MPEPSDQPIVPTVDKKDSIIVEGTCYIPIYLGHDKDGEKFTPRIVHLSQKEESFVKRFLETLSPEEAGKEIGVNLRTARRYLKRANIAAVIEQAIEKAAIRNGTDLDETVSWLRKARDGVVVPNDIQVKCAQTLAKVLKPASGNITVNANLQQNNFESPYSGMSAAEIQGAMRERLSAIQGGPTIST